MPSDLQLTSTVITSNSGSTVIKNYTVTSSTNTLLIFVEGPLDVVITGLSNPVRYLGSLNWNFTVSDVSDNTSSFTQVGKSPAYTSTTVSSIALQLTNYVI